jgi:hypothetical protein
MSIAYDDDDEKWEASSPATMSSEEDLEADPSVRKTHLLTLPYGSPPLLELPI